MSEGIDNNGNPLFKYEVWLSMKNINTQSVAKKDAAQMSRKLSCTCSYQGINIPVAYREQIKKILLYNSMEKIESLHIKI